MAVRGLLPVCCILVCKLCIQCSSSSLFCYSLELQLIVAERLTEREPPCFDLLSGALEPLLPRSSHPLLTPHLRAEDRTGGLRVVVFGSAHWTRLVLAADASTSRFWTASKTRGCLVGSSRQTIFLTVLRLNRSPVQPPHPTEQHNVSALLLCLSNQYRRPTLNPRAGSIAT